MARLVPGNGNSQKFRHPESYLAVDKHDNPLLRPMVSDDPFDSTRLPLHVDSDSRPGCRRFHGPVIHFISRLRAWFVLQAAGRQNTFTGYFFNFLLGFNTINKMGLIMTRNTLLSRPIIALIFLGFLFADPFIRAAFPSELETVENQVNAQSKNSKDFAEGQITVQFSQNEADTISAILPEGEVRQMFKNKLSIGGRKDDSSSDGVYREGEGLIPIFLESEKEFSHAQKQIHLLFTESKFSSQEWKATLDNINMRKGPGHLMLTTFILVVLIFCGLAMEKLLRRATEDIRRQLSDTASLGRLQFLGQVVSHFLLEFLGLGAFMLTTFVLFAFFYDEGDAGFAILTSGLLLSYYIRFAILASNLILSPTRPALRLLVLKDEDAKFLNRWFIGIAVTMMVGGTISYTLQGAGLSKENYGLIYSLAGFSVSLLVVVMIWRSRRRVARAICSDDPARDKAPSSIRARIAGTWHWFAMLGVLGMGVFWFFKGLTGETGALIPLIMSMFLIPIFIALNQWVERLLNTASGLSPPSFDPQGSMSRENISVPEAAQPEKAQDRNADRKFYLQQHLPLIKGAIRILLAALMLLLILRLWGIDLPFGRIFTSTALNILGMALLGIAVWQYTKARIDRKIREELPDDDEEMEEGGKGGSRIGTLLVLLRKFILSVLFVLVSLIILSSVGVNIGPLIAGAGVIGLAIGFGSQTLVRDILSGVFFLMDDAFRVGDYLECSGTKGTVEHISLRSLRLRNPRGQVYFIPFGDLKLVTNLSRDYVIMKLDFRVRYDADVEKIRKVIKKKVYQPIMDNPELGPKLLEPIKSQGVREMDDSAMIMRVKYKTKPGDQFAIRKEVYHLMQEAFKAEGIEFAHRNVTVYMPPESGSKASAQAAGEDQQKDAKANSEIQRQAAAGAALAVIQAEEEAEKAKKKPENEK